MEDLINYKELLEDLERHPLEFKFGVMYDIGASDGVFSRQFSKHLDIDYHLFEPRTYPQLEENEFKHFWHRVYLSDQEKIVDFFSNPEYGEGGGDSYMRERTSYYDEVPSKKVSTTTLDSYVTEHNIPLPNIIKLDTQGSELDILAGGTRCLNNAQLVIMEVPVVKYNSGAPSFDEIIEFMYKFKFIPFKTLRDHYVDDRYGNSGLVQIDMAFVKLQKSSLFFDRLN